MKKLTTLNRTLFALGLIAALTLPSASFSQSASAADIAKLQESLQAMRDAYEQRINALEQKITTLQQQNAPAATPRAAATPASSAKPGTATLPPAAITYAPQAPAAASTASTAPPAVPPAPTMARGVVLPKVGAFTPEISLVLDGKYSAQSQNPEALRRGFIPSGGESVPRGFSLGESEFAFAGTVDNLFRAEARLVLGQDGTDFSVALEEAFFETISVK